MLLTGDSMDVQENFLPYEQSIKHIAFNQSSDSIQILVKPGCHVPQEAVQQIEHLIKNAIANANQPQVINHTNSPRKDAGYGTLSDCESSSSAGSIVNGNYNHTTYVPVNNNDILNSTHFIQQRKNRGRGRPSKSPEEPLDVTQLESVPAEKRKYLELRYRNNLACRLARRKRKQQEEEIFNEETIEKERNVKLKAELKKYERAQEVLKKYLLEVIKKNETDSYKNIHSFKMFKMKTHKVIGNSYNNGNSSHFDSCNINNQINNSQETKNSIQEILSH